MDDIVTIRQTLLDEEKRSSKREKKKKAGWTQYAGISLETLNEKDRTTYKKTSERRGGMQSSLWTGDMMRT